MENKTCYEINQQILKVNQMSEALDWEIDEYKQKATSLLKELLIQKHLRIQRLFFTEMYISKQIQEPLDQLVFAENCEEVSANFASLVLPDSNFSKGPFKAFLNTLFDSLESFLPAFYKLNPKKLFTGFSKSPSKILLRCIFPSLFGFCWAEEPSISYAHNLATWFGELYRENPNFIQEFSKHWMIDAMRGFFTSLDVSIFVKNVIRPIFFDFVQLENCDILQKWSTKTSQNDPKTWIFYAERVIESIHSNFHLLPSVFNFFFSEILKQINEKVSDDINEYNDNSKFLIRYLFFDLFLQPFFSYPILNNISDVVLPKDDYILFYNIYLIIKMKLPILKTQEESESRVIETDFNSNMKMKNESILKIIKGNLDSKFDPFSVIFDDILKKRAALKYPLLRQFCEIVQCAHQPILITTYSLILLFRFVASLQHTAMIPKSIDRSISNVFQDALADHLENMPDFNFWFPCYSLTYMNIPKITLIEQNSPSSLYRLLSSPELQISPSDIDFNTAIINAELATNSITHPQLRTEIHWFVQNDGSRKSDDILSEINSEIERKQKECTEKRKRSLSLIKFTKILEKQKRTEMSDMSLSALCEKILHRYTKKNKINIRTNDFIENSLKIIKEISGNSEKLFSPHLAEALIVDLTPCVKYIIDMNDENCDSNSQLKNENENINLLRSLVSKPLLASSLYSTAVKLIPDLIVLKNMAEIISIENPFKLTYSESFCLQKPTNLAANFENLILSLPQQLLSLAFSEDDIKILHEFNVSYKKTMFI